MKSLKILEGNKKTIFNFINLFPGSLPILMDEVCILPKKIKNEIIIMLAYISFLSLFLRLYGFL